MNESNVNKGHNTLSYNKEDHYYHKHVIANSRLVPKNIWCAWWFSSTWISLWHSASGEEDAISKLLVTPVAGREGSKR